MIHWPRVRQLRDEVGAEEFDEVVRIFLDEVGEVMGRLTSDTDRSALEQNLHFLKGSALSLGFESLSKLCQDGERRAAAGHGAEVDLDAVIAAFDRSRTEFMSGLKDNL
ncbi:Hpt domain-containing protein [Ruegeria arenilitoris]|uniref:Hpt domain-containing protein n=1 Tax=Ruegeria arenilitoris TaxID=1173585 RepID=UPI00147A65B1|nr:Hpt domain-containing protein [Ruegeria arenilitoris]